VPRNEGVQDGVWGALDERLVAAATANAPLQGGRKPRFSEHGAPSLRCAGVCGLLCRLQLPECIRARAPSCHCLRNTPWQLLPAAVWQQARASRSGAYARLGALAREPGTAPAHQLVLCL
jgi:hypothetical protein